MSAYLWSEFCSIFEDQMSTRSVDLDWILNRAVTYWPVNSSEPLLMGAFMFNNISEYETQKVGFGALEPS